MAIIPRLLFYSVSVTFKEFEDAEGSKHPAVINSSILVGEILGSRSINFFFPLPARVTKVEAGGTWITLLVRWSRVKIHDVTGWWWWCWQKRWLRRHIYLTWSFETWVPWSDLLPTSTVAMLDTSALWLQADQLIVVMANAEMGRDERAEKVFLTLPLQVAGLTRYEIHGWQESSEVTRVHGLQWMRWLAGRCIQKSYIIKSLACEIIYMLYIRVTSRPRS